HAGADAGGALPGAGRVDDAVPEGPRAALERADGIDPAAAALLAGPGVVRQVDEEDAVVLAVERLLLAQADAVADAPEVAFVHLFLRLAQVARQQRHLLRADPDIPGRAAAAISALRAAEFQPAGVPRPGGVLEHGKGARHVGRS